MEQTAEEACSSHALGKAIVQTMVASGYDLDQAVLLFFHKDQKAYSRRVPCDVLEAASM